MHIHSFAATAILSLAAGLVLIPEARAQSEARGPTTRERQFPMDVRAAGGRLDGVDFELRGEDFAALAAEEAVSFMGVPLPGGAQIDLDLERVRLDTSRMQVYTNGEPRAKTDVDPNLTMWKGRVRGDADSYVFLAFSKYGSRGWIGTNGSVVHLLASPGADNDWARSTSKLIEDSALAELGLTTKKLCSLDRIPPPPATATAAPLAERRAVARNNGGVALGLSPPLQCFVAVETDYQLFLHFVNESAEIAYLTQLLGAANSKYLEQINTYLTVIYLGTYTSPTADKWDTPEDPNRDAVTMLYEFQNDWEQAVVQGGPAPNPANPKPAAAASAKLFHFLSGATLGGGVAYLGGICLNQYEYAISGDITLASGTTPFPVVQGPMNWDFTVLAHEIGHNFGSPHTQDFCPPIDQCWPAGGTGCTWTPVCSQGTLMSYCHLCPGSYANIIPSFHQQCVDLMRSGAEGCLPGYSEGNAYCFGDGLDPVVTAQCPCGNFGNPGRGCRHPNAALGGAKLVSYGSVNPNTITMDVTGVPNNTLCTFFRGSVNIAAGVVYGDGVRCFGGTSLRFGSQLSGQGGNLANSASAPAVSQTPGVTRYYQCQYRTPLSTFCPPEAFNVSGGWKLTW